MIWAVVLAAGESKRMGTSKLLLPFGTKTMIEKVIDNIISSKADRIMVVLGSGAERIKPNIENYPVKIVINSNFQQGMLSSVLCALKELPEATKAMMVFLGDQPLIPASVTDRIIDAFRKTGKGIVLPVFNNDRGHPVLIDLKYREEIQALNPDIGLRGLIYSQNRDIYEVKVNQEGILCDIDSMEDYQRELLKEKINE